MANRDNIELGLLRRQLEVARVSSPAESLQNGDGGGTSGGMDTRVTLLEYRADQTEKLLLRMDGKLDGIVKDLAGTRADIAGVTGALTGLPKTWQVLTINLGVMALVIAVVGGTVAALHALGKI